MSKSLKQYAPKYIYLTTGDDDAKVFGDKHEVTWCADQITKKDIKYVRVDMVKP